MSGYLDCVGKGDKLWFRMGQPLNTLYYGDNLDIVRRYIEDESVDLIYLDRPFNSKPTTTALRLIKRRRVLIPTGSIYLLPALRLRLEGNQTWLG